MYIHTYRYYNKIGMSGVAGVDGPKTQLTLLLINLEAKYDSDIAYYTAIKQVILDTAEEQRGAAVEGATTTVITNPPEFDAAQIQKIHQKIAETFTSSDHFIQSQEKIENYFIPREHTLSHFLKRYNATTLPRNAKAVAAADDAVAKSGSLNLSETQARYLAKNVACDKQRGDIAAAKAAEVERDVCQGMIESNELLVNILIFLNKKNKSREEWQQTTNAVHAFFDQQTEIDEKIALWRKPLAEGTPDAPNNKGIENISQQSEDLCTLLTNILRLLHCPVDLINGGIQGGAKRRKSPRPRPRPRQLYKRLLRRKSATRRKTRSRRRRSRRSRSRRRRGA